MATPVLRAFVPAALALCTLVLTGCPDDAGDGDGVAGTDTIGDTVNDTFDTSGTESDTFSETTFSETTFSDEDEGIDDLDGGGDSSGLQDCFAYLEACQQDPYCVCYVSCFAESEGNATEAECLAKCNLAQVPYWAQQFEDCIESRTSGDN